jgi:hypothetical protein
LNVDRRIGACVHNHTDRSPMMKTAPQPLNFLQEHTRFVCASWLAQIGFSEYMGLIG